jgi:O-antigen/teichoic acid export membrane protein
VIVLIYGGAYVEAVRPLQILLITSSVIFLNVALVNPLLAWDRQTEYMKIIAVGALANVVMNVLLIPRFGIRGAAVATLLAEISVAGFGIRAYVKDARHASALRPLFSHPFIASLLAFGITLGVSLLIPLNAPWNLGMFAGIYVCYLFLVKQGIRKSLSIV